MPDERGVGTIADVLAGIDWVIQRSRTANNRVMNLSLGGTSTDSFLIDPLARAARSATATATATATGIVVVTSAGNAGKTPDERPVCGSVSSPGHAPSVNAEGAANSLGTALRSDDRVARFSSRGPTRGNFSFASGKLWIDNLIKPDLVATGNRVISALASDSRSGTSRWNFLARSYPALTQVVGASQGEDRALMTRAAPQPQHRPWPALRPCCCRPTRA